MPDKPDLATLEFGIKGLRTPEFGPWPRGSRKEFFAAISNDLTFNKLILRFLRLMRAVHLTGLFLIEYDASSLQIPNKGPNKMPTPKLTAKAVEETLHKVVQKLDKRVQVVGVTYEEKKDSYRVSLLKNGITGSADLKMDLLKQHLSEEAKGNALRKALGKAVSRLSIRPKR